MARKGIVTLEESKPIQIVAGQVNFTNEQQLIRKLNNILYGVHKKQYTDREITAMLNWAIENSKF